MDLTDSLPNGISLIPELFDEFDAELERDRKNLVCFFRESNLRGGFSSIKSVSRAKKSLGG